MKRYMLCLVSCLVLAGSAYAQVSFSSWTKTILHNTVYATNTTASMTFSTTTFTPPLPPLSTPLITGIVYTWRPYPNGNNSETVFICYRRLYATNDLGCVNVSTIRSGTLHNFDNENAKGTVFVRHTLVGGTYPATASGVSDTITVNYSY